MKRRKTTPTPLVKMMMVYFVEIEGEEFLAVEVAVANSRSEPPMASSFPFCSVGVYSSLDVISFPPWSDVVGSVEAWFVVNVTGGIVVELVSEDEVGEDEVDELCCRDVVGVGHTVVARGVKYWIM